MSDDEYYEWEEEYLFEEIVPDLAVSGSSKVSAHVGRLILLSRLGRARRYLILRSCPIRRPGDRRGGLFQRLGLLFR